MDRSLGVVLPAYEPNIDRLAAYVDSLHGRLELAALRIELDDPHRRYADALADLDATLNVVHHRRGKGAAITDGFEQLETDVLAFTDADGAIPADSVAAVVEPIAAGEAAVATGSRRHPAASVRAHQTHGRRWLGHGFAWLARRLLAIELDDYQCGAKAVDRATWEAVRGHLREAGFGWDVELLAVADALGGRIVEVPVIWDDQPDSTVSPVTTPFELLRALLRARRRARRLSALAASGDEAPPLIDRHESKDD